MASSSVATTMRPASSASAPARAAPSSAPQIRVRIVARAAPTTAARSAMDVVSAATRTSPCHSHHLSRCEGWSGRGSHCLGSHSRGVTGYADEDGHESSEGVAGQVPHHTRTIGLSVNEHEKFLPFLSLRAPLPGS